MKNLFRGLYAAIIGLLLSFGLITATNASGNQRTMRSTGAPTPVLRAMPEMPSKRFYQVGQSIRFLFVPEDRWAYC